MKLLLSKLALSCLVFMVVSKTDLENLNSSYPDNQGAITDSSIVYKTKNLIVKKLSPHVYSHTSYLNTTEYGLVPCNGMLVIDNTESLIFDSPTNNEATSELLVFVRKHLKSKIIGVVPTHFHEDCIGGIEAFETENIPVYASSKTIELVELKDKLKFKSFENHLTLNVGNSFVSLDYYGAGHTLDNIIVYYQKDEIIFGGCLIKSLNAGTGYLGDANTKEWPKTVKKIKKKHPNVDLVIPGHGAEGGIELLDYTIDLFEDYNKKK